MSKLNQIQSELQAIDGGRFQKLCDAYLMQNPRYADLKPIGTVIGKDKTKTGVPDSIITLPDGTFAFAHYTTEASSLIGKLRKDYEKSFDEAHTEVPASEVKEIIFCHNGTLTTEEELSLIRDGRDKGIVIKIFGLERLSYDLLNRYPGIAKQFLQVEVDTGQIVSPQEFVALYGKNSLSTRLDTTFHFREEELKALLEAIEKRELILITGPAGVGKSRLMLEAGSRFSSEHEGWKVFCVFNRGADIFQDLRIYFKQPGCYLLLVDDANRLGGFKYVLQLLHDQSEEVKIKITATVRDYAREKIVEQAGPYGGGEEIQLKPFSDEQIRTLVSVEEGIGNYHFQKRIIDIARGNPRLAMMAARLAVKHNNFESISDVTSLYDEYFGSVRQDLQDLGSEEVIKIAGIISFFRVVDKTRHDLMDNISAVFDIPPSRFWHMVEQFDRLEILDLYENEIAKFSDQVFATYLFYLAVFKRGSLDFSTLLDHFFPSCKSLFVDVLNPVINSLGARIEGQLRQGIDRKWDEFAREERHENLIALIQTFWFVKQADTLLYIREAIRDLPAEEVDLQSLDFRNEGPALSFPLLDILGSFFGTAHAATALELVFGIFEKNPKTLGNVVRILKKNYGFRPDSTLLDFRPQRQVVDLLWKHTDDGKNPLFVQLFLTTAEDYLHTHFNFTEPRSALAIGFVNFDIPSTPTIHTLRQTIWRYIFSLYSVPDLQSDVLRLMRSHSHSGYFVSHQEILAKDAEVVIPFMVANLDPAIIAHISVAQDYLGLLDREGVAYDPAVREKFTNNLSRLSGLLFVDRFHRTGRPFEEEDARRGAALRDYVQGFSVEDYNHLLQQCLLIQQAAPGSERWELQRSIGRIFEVIEEKGPDFYGPIVETYLEMGAPFGFYVHGRQVMRNLVRFFGPVSAQETILRYDFPDRMRWLFDFYASIPPGEVEQAHLDQLYILYDSVHSRDLPADFDFLERYIPLDEGVIIRVVETLLRRSEENLDYAYRLGFLFNSHATSPEKLLSYFRGRLDLLKRAYRAAREAKDTSDYDGRVFNLILDHDPGFLRGYISQLVENAKAQDRRWLNRADDRDLLFLWERDDYETLIPETIRFLCEIGQREQMYIDGFLEATFGSSFSREKIDANLARRQATALRALISESASDADLMQFIFHAVGGLPNEHRRELIALFLQKNKAVGDFKRLSVEPLSGGWTGSAVPFYQSKLDFVESLLPLVEGLEYLDHRLYLENQIGRFQQQLEAEKRRDFKEEM